MLVRGMPKMKWLQTFMQLSGHSDYKTFAKATDKPRSYVHNLLNRDSERLTPFMEFLLRAITEVERKSPLSTSQILDILKTEYLPKEVRDKPADKKS